MTALASAAGVTPNTPAGVDKIPNAQTLLNITTNTVVKQGACRCARIHVIVAGAVGAAYDAATTGTEAAGTEFFVIPAAVGIYEVDWPCFTGLAIAPGAAQVVAVAFY